MWFCATAVIPALREEYALSASQVSALSSLVSVGFVAGTLGSALLGKGIVAERDTAALQERTRTLLGSVRTAREETT